MKTDKPTVTIGLPVYNGENFLAEAIESLLGQTYDDFELIISDNASTDGTEQICRYYEERDTRVNYVRNSENLGAAKNYNQLVTMARGKYFKWAAHDDLCADTFIERCVAVLDADPDVVLCYVQSQGIDGEGNPIHSYDNNLEAGETEPWKRFRSAACRRGNMVATVVFGLMRTEVLLKTHMIGPFSSSDRVLVGEMALYGQIYMVPEVLFFKRDHPQAHWIKYRTRQQRITWYDTSAKQKRTYPHWRILQEHFISMRNAPMSTTDRLKCYATLPYWMRYKWRALLLNLVQRDKKAKRQDEIAEQDRNQRRSEVLVADRVDSEL